MDALRMADACPVLLPGSALAGGDLADPVVMRPTMHPASGRVTQHDTPRVAPTPGGRMAAPLIRRQHLDESAARCLRRISPTPKKAAAAFGWTARSTTSRAYSGEMASPVTHALRTVDTLARAAGTSPWPLIVESIVVARAASLEKMGTPWLEYRLAELRDRIPTNAANVQRMAMRPDATHAEHEMVAKELADLVEEYAAIHRVLAERPRDA